MRLAACGLLRAACGLWLAACGLRLVACGLWLAACGLWLAACAPFGVQVPTLAPRIADTFAEAFDMRAARVVITAHTPGWALTAAQSMTGFATSVIGCKVEAGIEAELDPGETPDGRPGLS